MSKTFNHLMGGSTSIPKEYRAVTFEPGSAGSNIGTAILGNPEEVGGLTTGYFHVLGCFDEGDFRANSAYTTVDADAHSITFA